MPETPHREHEQIPCDNGSEVILIDRGLSHVVRGLWLRGISTQACCERDYVRLANGVTESDHAYIGFSSGDDLTRFLEAVARADPRVFQRALRSPASALPWLGNGYADLVAPPHTGLADLGERWAYGVAPWVLSTPRAQVHARYYAAFPVTEIAHIDEALNGL